METAHTLIDEHPQIFDLDYLQQDMAIGWTDEDARQLEESLAPYLAWIQRFLGFRRGLSNPYQEFWLNCRAHLEQTPSRRMRCSPAWAKA